MSRVTRFGLIGCGKISGAYLNMAKNFPSVQCVACADVFPEAAKAAAQTYGVPRVCSVEELLADPEVELVLNLTVPKAHAHIALEAIGAGKHTYAEKPLGITREEGESILEAARRKGVRVGCAPDTVLGAGIQTARRLIEKGAIGRPVAFAAEMMSFGPEPWHPNPEFFYEPGGGPMFDMGPYYLTALLNLFGQVRRISGYASVAIPDRVVGSGPRQGKKINVETPDHVAGVLEFENGVIGTLVTSFAICHRTSEGKHPITVWGTQGALRVPDPNTFDGTVLIRRLEETEWTEVPPMFTTGYGRSVGLADMVAAMAHDRPHRCSAEQAMATLDLMQGFLDSSRSGQSVMPTISYTPPAPMLTNLPFGQLDA